MAEKLSWSYEGDGEVAYHKGYRIRAVHDDHPENPFKMWNGHWPMLVRHRRAITTYDKVTGPSPEDVLNRFTDGQLVHDQKAIAAAIGSENLDDVRYHMGDVQLEDGDPPKWITDADVLRDWFFDSAHNISDSEKFDVWEKLYDLLGIPCLNTSSHGHCQGDYAELLIVATPEAQAELRSQPEGMSDEEWKAALAEDMDSQAKLYGYWAWGDVYGFVVEKLVRPDTCTQCDTTLSSIDGDECPQCIADIEPEWEEIPGGSCWGYYGADHHESGLEEAALGCIPDDKPVTSRDNNQSKENDDVHGSPSIPLCGPSDQLR